MLQLACHAWSYNHLPLADAVGTIARLGFQCIDLGTGPHLDVIYATQDPLKAAEKIRVLLNDFNLMLTDLYILLPHINAPEPEQRQEQLGLFESLVPFAVALGTPGITISPGLLHPDGADHSLARAVPAMQQLLDVTEDTDLRISFEPHLESAAYTLEQIRLLLDAVPGLSLTLDIAHLIAQNIDIVDIYTLFEFAAHIHIRQAAPMQVQTAFSDGIVNMGRLVEALIEADYHGALSVEYVQGLEGSITQEIVKIRDVLREARHHYASRAF